MNLAYVHLNTQGTFTLTPDGYTALWTLNVNKAAAGSTVTVIDGQDANGIVIAAVDGGTVASKAYAVKAAHGLTVVIAGGSPDVTIGYP